MKAKTRIHFLQNCCELNKTGKLDNCSSNCSHFLPPRKTDFQLISTAKEEMTAQFFFLWECDVEYPATAPLSAHNCSKNALRKANIPGGSKLLSLTPYSIGLKLTILKTKIDPFTYCPLPFLLCYTPTTISPGDGAASCCRSPSIARRTPPSLTPHWHSLASRQTEENSVCRAFPTSLIRLTDLSIVATNTGGPPLSRVSAFSAR